MLVEQGMTSRPEAGALGVLGLPPLRGRRYQMLVDIPGYACRLNHA